MKNHLENIKKASPIIHCITNYVTINDCANILYALGAKPIMADFTSDIKEITSCCDALYINIGTLNKLKIKSIKKATKIANKSNIPVLLDLVGINASSFRLKFAKKLLKTRKISVIKGNATEIKTLYLGYKSVAGIDADIKDKLTDKNISFFVLLSKKLSKKLNSFVVITGKTDLISNGEKTYLIKNGHKLMESVTGTGCMLGALLSAFIGANKNDMFLSCVSGLFTNGICGENAYNRMNEKDGNASYRNYLIDEVFNFDEIKLKEGAKYEIG